MKLSCQTDINSHFNSFADGSDKKTNEGSSSASTEVDNSKVSDNVEDQVSFLTMCLTALL
jgi:hypothetical protein